MNIAENYLFPLRNIKALFLGAVFTAVPSLFSVLVIALGNLYISAAVFVPFIVLVVGYLCVLAETQFTNPELMPGWFNFKDIFMNGLKLFPAVFVFIGLPIIATFSVSNTNLLFLFSFLSAFFSFFLPFIIARFAETKRFADSFRFDIVFRKFLAVWKEYLVTFFLMIPLLLVFITVSNYAKFTIIIPAFLDFYFYIVFVRAMAVLYAKTI